MRFTALILLLFSLVGCAHIDRARAAQVTVFQVMSDAEIARTAVEEALGELHEVQEIDAETGLVTRGQAAFRSRQERLDFEARVDALIRARVYGQGPTLELVRIRCLALQQSGWKGWPEEEATRRRACEYGDELLTLHSLFKKPMLQRAYIDVLLSAVEDADFAGHARARLSELSSARLEPYVFTVEAWERVEGFRPRG